MFVLDHYDPGDRAIMLIYSLANTGRGFQQLDGGPTMSMDFTEQWSNMQKMFLPTSEVSTALQKMFLPTPEIAATFRENARRFWENQGRALDSMQALANGWFERRRTGTHSAREAAERMCGTETYFDLMQTYQDWARGAFERIMADGLSCQQQIMAATGALASPPLAPSVSEKQPEPARSETRAPARSKTP